MAQLPTPPTSFTEDNYDDYIFDPAKIFDWLGKTKSPSRRRHGKATEKLKRLVAGRNQNGMDNAYYDSTPSSPSKRQRRDEILDHRSASWEDDLEKTPRALNATPPATLGHPPQFNIPQRPKQLDRVSNRDNQSEASYRSQSSTKSRRRERSPVKKMADLLTLHEPIIKKQFDLEELPQDVMILYLGVEAISQGEGVISQSCWDDITARSRSDANFSNIRQFSYCNSGKRDADGPTPTADQVAKLVRLAKICDEDGHCEASWNGRVHTTILDLALYNDVYLSKVDFLNCTVAKIEPESLFPPDTFGGIVEGKMVDFAIYLCPDVSMDNSISLVLIRDSSQVKSINHTNHQPLRRNPIAINIETKLMNEDWETALVQTSVWLASQFTKIESLMALAGSAENDFPAIPPLPVLVIQGHNWNFLVGKRVTGKKTYLYETLPFGSTSTPLGVYKIVAGIQYLSSYAQNIYRSWFCRWALGMADTETD